MKPIIKDGGMATGIKNNWIGPGGVRLIGFSERADKVN
tara:strand:+ start:295 stop:408 length:114 start_codon:yes stop_codon:yes gene_type:complete